MSTNELVAQIWFGHDKVVHGKDAFVSHLNTIPPSLLCPLKEETGMTCHDGNHKTHRNQRGHQQI